MNTKFQKVFAGVSVAAIALTQVGTALAAYSDVPAGVWYEEAVMDFMNRGYLDANQARFRGSDPATRAEFIKLVVEVNGGILGTAPAQPSFNDVPTGAWYYNYIEEAADEGWVMGDGNCYGSKPCYARPDARINRAEAASLITRAFGLDWTGDAPQFVDNPSGQWYTDAIQTAADYCVVQGDDSTGRVRPGDFMNRAEMVTMLYRVDQNLTYGVDCGGDTPMTWGIDDVMADSATLLVVTFSGDVDMATSEMAGKYSVMCGSTMVPVTGASMVADDTVELTLGSALDANADCDVTVTNMMAMDGGTFSDAASFSFRSVPVGMGDLEVSMSSNNPAGDTVPRGANGVTMLSVDLSASCADDVVLNDITLLHRGFGEETDITGLYAAADGARVTRKRTIDSQAQTAEVRFTKPFVIPACQTKTLDIMADFSTSASSYAEHNISVELATDVESNARSVTGAFPIMGNTFRVAAVTAGTITINYKSVSPSTVKVGDDKATLGRFEISTNSIEDQTLYSITIHNDGSVNDGDLSNLMIRKSDGTVLSNTVAVFEGDYATFTFNPPFTILQGDKITLEVVGDVLGGASDTAKFEIEETSDIFAVGSLYGYGNAGQLYGSQVSITASPAAATVTIDAGQFTVEIDGPVTQKFRRDTKDAVLANVIMTPGGENLDVKKLFVAVQAQTSAGLGLQTTCGTSFDEVRELIDNVDFRNTVNGRTVSAVRLTDSGTNGTGNGATDTYQIYRFDDFTIDSQATWQLRADFIDNGSSNCPSDGMRFRVMVCTQAAGNTVGCDFGGVGGLTTSTTTYNMDVEGLSTNDRLTDVRPGGTVTGNYHRIATPTLTLNVQSSGTADVTVKNAKNVNLYRFEARAGEADDLLVTRFVFRAFSGSLLNGQNYTLWVDTDGDRAVDTKLEAGKSQQSSLITFDRLLNGGYVIPKEQTVVFEVHADISASLVNNDLAIKFNVTTPTTTDDYVAVEQAVNGSSLSGIRTDSAGCSSNCEIVVTGASGAVSTGLTAITGPQVIKNWTLASQGNLYARLDDSPLRNRQLLAGDLGESILRLRMRAENEDINVTDLQINSSGATLANTIDALDLYMDGATTPFASATIVGCGSDDVRASDPQGAASTTFCANMESNQLVVQKGVEKVIVVRPRLKNDINGAVSGTLVQLFIGPENALNNATGSGAIRARGLQSSNDLTGNNGTGAADGEIFIGTNTNAANALTIVGKKNVTVRAKIDSITNANPSANGTAVPTGVTPFGQFKFTAMANTNSLNGANKFALSGAVFNVNASNVTMDATLFKFYNKADQNQKVACTAYTGTATHVAVSSGSFVVRCPILATGSSTVNTIINSGDNATFVLEGSVINPKVANTNSTLLASIQNFSDISRTTFLPAATAVTSVHSSISWVDFDTAVTAGSKFSWIEYPDTVVNSTSYNG